MDLQFIADHLPTFLRAAASTTVVFFATAALGTVLGMATALSRLYGPPSVATLALLYSWALRGIPALVVLFFMFYGLPSLGFVLRPVQAAVIGLSLSTGAYMSEIFKAGLMSVGRRQFEASKALGFSFGHMMRHIIIPQTVRVILPPWTSNLVLLLKGTALAGVIAVNELTGTAYALVSITYRPIEVFLPVATVYLLMASLLMLLLHVMEERWALREKAP
jgi:His/Glu/Gln/Arg/opine family amino acid ABC transporter permease subunit